MSEFNEYDPSLSPYAPPEYQVVERQPKGPEGLSGWLILVAIGICLSPFRIGANLLTVFVPIFSDGTWQVLTSPDSEFYHPLWAPLLIYEIIGNLGFIVAYITLAVLFFSKSRYFPKTYIVVAILGFLFIVFDAWLASFVLTDEPMFDPETMKEVIRSLVGITIWVPYMLVSKRVKNTFVK